MTDTRIKGVVFNEEAHRYFYDGRELLGVTGAVCSLLGKSFPDTDVVKLAAIYGSDVHKEIENHFNSNGKLWTDGAKFAVKAVEDFCLDLHEKADVESEVMVSDFVSTASKVDIVVHTADRAWLFDVKTTAQLDRPYCSLQLSVYKKLYEECYGLKVEGLYVLGTKTKRMYRILAQDEAKVARILKMNKDRLGVN